LDRSPACRRDDDDDDDLRALLLPLGVGTASVDELRTDGGADFGSAGGALDGGAGGAVGDAVARWLDSVVGGLLLGGGGGALMLWFWCFWFFCFFVLSLPFSTLCWVVEKKKSERCLFF
jgi:hypothetical protein